MLIGLWPLTERDAVRAGEAVGGLSAEEVAARVRGAAGPAARAEYAIHEHRGDDASGACIRFIKRERSNVVDLVDEIISARSQDPRGAMRKASRLIAEALAAALIGCLTARHDAQGPSCGSCCSVLELTSS